MDIQDKIATWIKQSKEDLDQQAELSATTDLLHSGLLDSLDLLQLITYIEDEFRLKIPVEALTPENFSSISSISGLVEGIMRGSADMINTVGTAS